MKTGHFARHAIVALGLLAGACGGASEPAPAISTPTAPVGPSGPIGQFVFSAYPIEMTTSTNVSAIGFPTNVVPSWQMQFYGITSFGRLVFAPAAGTVVGLGMDEDARAWMEVAGAENILYKLDGAQAFSVSVGQQVAAGQTVGTRRKDDRGRDLGIYLSVRKPTPSFYFARPDRYPTELVMGANPLDYYAKTLRQQIEALMPSPLPLQRLSFDEPGRLSGQWFAEGADPGKTFTFAGMKQWLWFFQVRTTAGDEWRAYFPGIANDVHNRWIEPSEGVVWPGEVRAGSGVMRYRMRPTSEGANTLILFVEMLDDSRVRVESFDTYYTPSPTGFTDKAKIYVR